MTQIQPASGFETLYLRDQLADRRRRLSAPGLDGRADVRALIADVDAALERLERGELGRCEACHDSIESERLMADPLVRVCLGCLSPRQARALEADLELAASIQTALLPAGEVDAAGWQVRYHYRPLGPVSGDHCDVLPPRAAGQPLHFVFGDVAGKGVAASILMSNLHAIFRSLLPTPGPLVEVVRRANRLFAESTPSSAHATLVAGRMDAAGGVELCNAGHCRPLLVRTGEVSALPVHGLPLGLFSDAEFGTTRAELQPGDLLLLYTDGLSETRDELGGLYGEGRLAELLRGMDGASPAEVVGACLADADAFRGAAAREDDLTVMAIRRAAAV